MGTWWACIDRAYAVDSGRGESTTSTRNSTSNNATDARWSRWQQQQQHGAPADGLALVAAARALRCRLLLVTADGAGLRWWRDDGDADQGMHQTAPSRIGQPSLRTQMI
eukprot:TRINITY_DN10675_c1_g1_i1.p4 TRINITY_DN10675_c1_g1~~TRINITY_DN10675_c1_g1_i1.p4  ORF type:complete len:109 (-),score=1.03 TRINITY_DN10675_c1_g1_i1:179-505(-)